MKRLACCMALLAGPALAETALPALHDVAGVAANDVLNIRAEPNGSSPIIGMLGPSQTGIEVVHTNESGNWALVNTGEMSGWVSLTFLKPQDNSPWYALESIIQCNGTEPFWSLKISPNDKTAHIVTPDEEGPEMDLAATWPGTAWNPVAALQMATDEGSAMAVIRANACSDGMSDRAYGLSVDVFSSGTTAAVASAMRGCCTLNP